MAIPPVVGEVRGDRHASGPRPESAERREPDDQRAERDRHDEAAAEKPSRNGAAMSTEAAAPFRAPRAWGVRSIGERSYPEVVLADWPVNVCDRCGHTPV